MCVHASGTRRAPDGRPGIEAPKIRARLASSYVNVNGFGLYGREGKGRGRKRRVAYTSRSAKVLGRATW